MSPLPKPRMLGQPVSPAYRGDFWAGQLLGLRLSWLCSRGWSSRAFHIGLEMFCLGPVHAYLKQCEER